MNNPVSPPMEIPCCSPATTESVAVVRDKVADSRADVLIGQGHILKSQGDYASALGANIDRSVLASMSQTDKYGLANLNATHFEADKVAAQVDRSSYGLSTDVRGGVDRISEQANGIAWAQNGNDERRINDVRAAIERSNDSQSSYSDRAFKYSQQQTADSFGRLSAQGENGFARLSTQADTNFGRLSAQGEAGFYRTGVAIAGAEKQTVMSEMNLGRSVNAGFTDSANTQRELYGRLSQQHCDLKSSIAEAQLLASREILGTGRELGLQSASNFGAVQLQSANNYGGIQVEASKNTAAIQLQASMIQKENLLEQSKWFALSERTAMLNKCELESKLAACCCEIKEAVTGTASATQGLIQSIESNRVRDALTALSTENAILKMRHEGHHHGR